MPLKRKSPKSTKRRTIEIFTKLLAINTVANSFLGLSISLTIRLLVGLFSSFSSSISVGENEKRATSAPDMSAEHNSNKKKIAN